MSETSGPSVLLRKDVIEALRRGTVPRRGLDLFAVGTDRFSVSLKEELDRCATGGAVFKALRGDFGYGKSFTARWYQQQALARGFAVAEVQISENDTPLHRLETVYRRATEGLRTAEWVTGAFRAIISQWLMGLEEEVSRTLRDPDDLKALSDGVGNLLEARLKDVSAVQPQYAAVLRAYHAAEVEGDHALSEGLIAWLMGQPNVSANIKQQAGIKGEIDHTGALGFLRGLLAVLQQCGRPGLLLVLDEVETIQRVRSDSRDRSLEAIRKLIDDLYGGRFAGLYILITGTPAFGERGHCGMVAVPSLEEEDARRPSRERENLVGERTRIVNRMKAALARLGIRGFKPELRKAAQQLELLHTPEESPIPPNTLDELRRDLARLAILRGQIIAIEQTRLERLEQAPHTGVNAMIRLLASVIGVGIETADMLVREALSRGLRDRRAVARYAGLTGSPDESGTRRHEKGLAKSGNARVRRGMIQLAWRFLMFQRDSVLAQWFRARTEGVKGTRKTKMIVALARKLLIALWRMVTTGEVPQGVVLRQPT